MGAGSVGMSDSDCASGAPGDDNSKSGLASVASLLTVSDEVCCCYGCVVPVVIRSASVGVTSSVGVCVGRTTHVSAISATSRCAVACLVYPAVRAAVSSAVVIVAGTVVHWTSLSPEEWAECMSVSGDGMCVVSDYVSVGCSLTREMVMWTVSVYLANGAGTCGPCYVHLVPVVLGDFRAYLDGC